MLACATLSALSFLVRLRHQEIPVLVLSPHNTMASFACAPQRMALQASTSGRQLQPAAVRPSLSRRTVAVRAAQLPKGITAPPRIPTAPENKFGFVRWAEKINGRYVEFVRADAADRPYNQAVKCTETAVAVWLAKLLLLLYLRCTDCPIHGWSSHLHTRGVKNAVPCVSNHTRVLNITALPYPSQQLLLFLSHLQGCYAWFLGYLDRRGHRAQGCL